MKYSDAVNEACQRSSFIICLEAICKEKHQDATGRPIGELHRDRKNEASFSNVIRTANHEIDKFRPDPRFMRGFMSPADAAVVRAESIERAEEIISRNPDWCMPKSTATAPKTSSEPNELKVTRTDILPWNWKRTSVATPENGLVQPASYYEPVTGTYHKVSNYTYNLATRRFNVKYIAEKLATAKPSTDKPNMATVREELSIFAAIGSLLSAVWVGIKTRMPDVAITSARRAFGY